MSSNNGWFKLDSPDSGKPQQARSGRPSSQSGLSQKHSQPGPKKQPQPSRPSTPRASRSPQMPVPPSEFRQNMARMQEEIAPPPRPHVPRQGLNASQTVGERGPVLAQDTVLHENLADFVTTPTRDRVVHTKGYGAFGHFQTTHSMKEYTKASLFQTPGTRVQAAVRFSLAVSTKGTADTSRNVRGFATKLFTEDGVYDLLCNHLPVFLVQDAMRFPESIRSLFPSPANNLGDPNSFWRFYAGAPEATHFITWLYSDTGTIKSVRKIRAFSVNTYVWRNAEGKRTYVKYHWLPKAGEEHIDRKEAARLAGENPDVAGQDLFQTIAKGGAVEYDLHVQLMDPSDEAHLPFDPLDDTKVWDEGQYPLMPVGKLTLNRNPDNYGEQVEQLAFAPSNLIDGIELSDDKMLQGRSFIYPDAQRHRLGHDFRKLPANRQPSWKPGDMITSGNGRQVSGTLMRPEPPKQDYFSQAGQRYQALSPVEQDHLVENLAADLSAATPDLQKTALSYLGNAAPELSGRVSQEIAKLK